MNIIYQISVLRRSRVSASVPRLPFTFFLELPIEIRHTIWELITCCQRNVGIWFTDKPSYQGGHWSTNVAPPAILHVSQEARAIGLKFYGLEFPTNAKPIWITEETIIAKIYFSWEYDRLCFVGDIVDMDDVSDLEYTCCEKGLRSIAFAIDPETAELGDDWYEDTHRRFIHGFVWNVHKIKAKADLNNHNLKEVVLFEAQGM